MIGLALSATGLFKEWLLTGQRHPRPAFALGLANQLLWIAAFIYWGQYLVLLGEIPLAALYAYRSAGELQLHHRLRWGLHHILQCVRR